MRPQSLAIVGIDYPNKRGPGRRFEVEICRPGESVELRPEPKNPFDEHAIAVYSCRGVQLGYLQSERAVFIGKLMREGHDVTAIYQAVDSTCAWMRVAFDGDAPTLPAAALSRGDIEDSGFYPDAIYEDD